MLNMDISMYIMKERFYYSTEFVIHNIKVTHIFLIV